MQRPGQPKEVAPVYVMRAADDTSYVSGATVAVTGGKPILEPVDIDTDKIEEAVMAQLLSSRPAPCPKGPRRDANDGLPAQSAVQKANPLSRSGQH
jgi:hypothetical protein